MLREIDETMAEMDAVETDRLRQHGLQIGAMDAPVRAAELPPIARLAAMMADHRAAASVAIDESRNLRTRRVELRTQSHAFVEARRVGRQRDGRADFAQLAGLFIELRVDAVLAQRERQRQAADAGADDRDRQIRLHDEGVSDIQIVGSAGMRRTLRSGRTQASYRYCRKQGFIPQ